MSIHRVYEGDEFTQYGHNEMEPFWIGDDLYEAVRTHDGFGIVRIALHGLDYKDTLQVENLEDVLVNEHGIFFSTNNHMLYWYQYNAEAESLLYVDHVGFQGNAKIFADDNWIGVGNSLFTLEDNELDINFWFTEQPENGQFPKIWAMDSETVAVYGIDQGISCVCIYELPDDGGLFLPDTLAIVRDCGFASHIQGDTLWGVGGYSLSRHLITAVWNDVEESDQATIPPQTPQLSIPWPNPFNPSVTIPYALPATTETTISIYNILGQRITQLVNRTMDAGYHHVVWNGRSQTGLPVASGVYFVTMEADGFFKTRKIVLMK